MEARDVECGAHGVTVAKIEAHNSLRVTQQLPRESRTQCLASREADVAAKFGAGLNGLQLARSQAMSEASARVTGVLQYFASLLTPLRDCIDWKDADSVPDAAGRQSVWVRGTILAVCPPVWCSVTVVVTKLGRLRAK